ncbi:MAG: DNA replication protein [Devosia sp.]|uniref:DUF6456 domain-containing protein n=1 Tax=Devosia sp. TaxID=1871048 RepID=UPI001A40F85D|nr:DUF6456 domain-containing protein [Devosia sp.]MBL8596297.1 DNA replication protein [Devosia sp.]
MPRDFAAQHRLDATDGQGRQVNLAESPLSRLAAGETAFLQPHHLEAGERVRRLVERSLLQPAVTMNYGGVVSGGGHRVGAGDLADMAVDARRTFDAIHRALPAECAGVVMDVCGWLKGLQEVERDRGWPRRSAKLVLRIGLEQLAQHFGLGPHAVGKTRVPQRSWMDGERPQMRF